MVLGIMGVYIGKIFNEVKGRPLYVVEEKIGFGLSGVAKGRAGALYERPALVR